MTYTEKQTNDAGTHEQKWIQNRELSLIVHHMPCTVPSSDAKNSETETSKVSSCVHLS